MHGHKNKKYEFKVHTIALVIAILGPLINRILGFGSISEFIGNYLYWSLCLLIYLVIIVPLTYRFPLTLLRLIILGITVEDFASNAWQSLFSGDKFLPFYNWYIQYFPFMGSLGEPTPYILIPRWYMIALFLYLLLTIIQFRKKIRHAINFSRKLELIQ